MIRRWLAAHFDSADYPLVSACDCDDVVYDYGVVFNFIWSWS